MLTEKDLDLLKKKQITTEEINRQLEVFKKGIPFAYLEDSATIGDGIIRCTPNEADRLVSLYDAEVNKIDVLKFVPASGAASRMFKSLFSFLEKYNYENQSLPQYIQDRKALGIEKFFKHIELFPFYEEVVEALKKDGFTFEDPQDGFQAITFVKKMLLDSGLNYGKTPKGLLPFHNYKNDKVSAFEEHLFEAAAYSKSRQKARLHFTVSEAHKIEFENELQAILDKIQKETSTVFDISFSFQKGKTDTISVTPENEPFRDKNGNLVFRPSGHGALIENLNEQEADLIFIKNIDNVVVSCFRSDTAFYKKLLAGKLIEVQHKAFDFAKKINENTEPHIETDEIFEFLRTELNVRFSGNPENLEKPDKIALLKSALNRPIRVCGMVKNQGDPGGGPFWVRNESGQVSLQIVESAQINKKDNSQKSILKSSTYFNPVDIVCGVKNYKGEKYNLLDFVDTNKGFITSKTYEGRPLKGLELPGLWNGAMAGWNTIFIEVPLSTFNPVKTVLDLLKESHQPKS
jgi:hypothetical protein